MVTSQARVKKNIAYIALNKAVQGRLKRPKTETVQFSEIKFKQLIKSITALTIIQL